MIYVYLDIYYSMKLIISWKHLFLFTDYRKGAQGDSNVEVQTTNIILGKMDLRSASQSTSCV